MDANASPIIAYIMSNVILVCVTAAEFMMKYPVNPEKNGIKVRDSPDRTSIQPIVCLIPIILIL